jgi:hypothetical protein
LKDGRIRYEAQAVFGGRRPDFVLPDVKELNAKGSAYDDYSNVITFRQFFDDEVKAKRPSLILPL